MTSTESRCHRILRPIDATKSVETDKKYHGKGAQQEPGRTTLNPFDYGLKSTGSKSIGGSDLRYAAIACLSSMEKKL